MPAEPTVKQRAKTVLTRFLYSTDDVHDAVLDAFAAAGLTIEDAEQVAEWRQRDEADTATEERIAAQRHRIAFGP